MGMEKSNLPLGISIEKVNKLKEVLSQVQLYTIADALMRSYHSPVNNSNRIEQTKIKKILELIVAACPNAKHYLTDM